MRRLFFVALVAVLAIPVLIIQFPRGLSLWYRAHTEAAASHEW